MSLAFTRVCRLEPEESLTIRSELVLKMPADHVADIRVTGECGRSNLADWRLEVEYFILRVEGNNIFAWLNLLLQYLLSFSDTVVRVVASVNIKFLSSGPS